MDVVEVKRPIHHHPMKPWKDGRVGYCCGIKFEAISDGYYCEECDLFFHKICSHAPDKLEHALCNEEASLGTCYYTYGLRRCEFCHEKVPFKHHWYKCESSYCEFEAHFGCVHYIPQKIVNVPLNHNHQLKIEKRQNCFTCASCGKDGDGYSYKCHECDLTFHVNCGKYEAEVNHPSHTLHPLKLFFGEPPAYTDGKCTLCGKEPLGVFYHCSACNFTLDSHCVFDPTPLYFEYDLYHPHKLTLMSKLISFTCNNCGLNGDRSPYVCLPCNFTIHNGCTRNSWVININRHEHRVTHTFLLGVVNAVCGVCRKKMDWSCGGYSCLRCPPGYVFHTKCATRRDVWDGLDMRGITEEDEDTEPFKKIDENTIQHYSHKEHHLRLDKSGVFIEEREICDACSYPIYHDSFYSCMSCNFILHENCAKLPTKKRHVVSTQPYLLHRFEDNYSKCEACGLCFNGFIYGERPKGLDMRCASISGSFFHQSHPEHPLFYTSPKGVCNVCKKEASHVLRCVEEGCEYILDFKCALLPYKIKHRVDDHFLSLCYGEESYASGKYWCDICEKETDPKSWFYTCELCGVTLHTNCVLGDFRGLKPRREFTLDSYKGARRHLVVRNSGMSRPLCSKCKSRCIFPVFLVSTEGSYLRYHCSAGCSNIENTYVDYFNWDRYNRSVLIKSS